MFKNELHNNQIIQSFNQVIICHIFFVKLQLTMFCYVSFQINQQNYLPY